MASPGNSEFVARVLESTRAGALKWERIGDEGEGRHAARLPTGQVIRLGTSARVVKRGGRPHKYEGVELVLLSERGATALRLHQKVGVGQEVADALAELRRSVLEQERVDGLGKALAGLDELGAQAPATTASARADE